MPNHTLYIVRHGQYSNHAAPGAPPDGPLTALGVTQARRTAERLRELPISLIHHSTLQRAIETAHIIAEQHPNAKLSAAPLLCECIPSVPSAHTALFATIPAHAIAAGAVQAPAAFDAFIGAHINPVHGGQEIIVSSGNLIGYFVSRCLGAPLDAWLQTDIQHCGITELRLGPPRGTWLVRHNDIGHLPAKLQTYT